MRADDVARTTLARRPGPADAPAQRRAVRKLSRNDVLPLAGAFFSGMCTTLLLFGRLTPMSGGLGFVAVFFVMFCPRSRMGSMWVPLTLIACSALLANYVFQFKAFSPNATTASSSSAGGGGGGGGGSDNSSSWWSAGSSSTWVGM